MRSEKLSRLISLEASSALAVRGGRFLSWVLVGLMYRYAFSNSCVKALSGIETRCATLATGAATIDSVSFFDGVVVAGLVLTGGDRALADPATDGFVVEVCR